jgi:hypothetical protein
VKRHITGHPLSLHREISIFRLELDSMSLISSHISYSTGVVHTAYGTRVRTLLPPLALAGNLEVKL